ncbi:hypothetical protein ABB02_00572 [Clostridiaceae bacterium JG1575]|nr:hypothetical protein ABB02_00572 [Clostridiaceae bacterium JG1575]
MIKRAMRKQRTPWTKYSYLLWAVIFIVPLLYSVLGLDTADTGGYLYWYRYPTTPKASLFTYLSTLVGAFFLRLFPGFELLGLQLLEAVLILVLALFTYHTLKKPLGEKASLLGTAGSVCLTTTYIKIFNFHQFNMVLQVFAALWIYRGFDALLVQRAKEDAGTSCQTPGPQKQWKAYRTFFLAGLFAGAALLARITSILGLLYLPFCVLFAKGCRFKGRTLWGIGLSFVGGVALCLLCMAGGYALLGVNQRIAQEALRLKVLGGTGGSNLYSVTRMIKYLVADTAYGMLLAFGIFFFSLVGTLWSEHSLLKGKRWLAYGIRALWIFLVGLFLVLFTYFFGVFPKNWASMTGFNWLLHGALLCTALNEIVQSLRGRRDPEHRSMLLAFLGTFVLFLSFVGSAARLRHTIMGTWILLPLFFFFIGGVARKGIGPHVVFAYPLHLQRGRRLLAVVLCLSLTGPLLFHMATINMYDDANPFALTATVQAPMVRGVRTTVREAQALQGVVDHIKEHPQYPKTLMVFGNSVLFYVLTGKEAYVHPWITVYSYLTSEFVQDLAHKKEGAGPLPLIIVNRTDPYHGFAQGNYEELLLRETTRAYAQKRTVLEDYLKENRYIETYQNDYFRVYHAPKGGTQ